MEHLYLEIPDIIDIFHYCTYDSIIIALDQGINPDTDRWEGDPLLMLSINVYSIVRILLEHGADPDYYGNKNTPLTEAVLHRYGYSIDLLLQYGADPNMQALYTDEPSYPMEIAYANNDIHTIRLLLQYGADPNLYSDSEPLIVYAVEKNQCNKVELLLQYGADPNTRDSMNDTILINAIRNENADMVDLLLRYGAHKGILSDDGDSPLEIAQEMENVHIINLLS